MDGMMGVWKLLLLVVQAGAQAGACIDYANEITGGVTNSVDGRSRVEGIECWCFGVGEGVGWKEVELDR